MAVEFRLHLGPGGPFAVAGLDHVSLDHAIEELAVEEPVADQLLDMGRRQRRVLFEEAQDHRALVGLEDSDLLRLARGGWGRRRRRRLARGQAGGGEEGEAERRVSHARTLPRPETAMRLTADGLRNLQMAWPSREAGPLSLLPSEIGVD